MSFSLSPTALDRYNKCHRCFWLYHNENKPGFSETSFPSLPSGMDMVTKWHFDDCRKKGILPPGLADLEEGIVLYDDLENLNRWRDHTTGLYWEDAEGNVLKGALDDVLQQDDTLIVLDFKSRGFPPKPATPGFYQHQLDIYTFLLQQEGQTVADFAFLLFYYPKRFTQYGNVMFKTELVKMDVSPARAKDLFYDAIELLEGPEPECSKHCRFTKLEEWLLQRTR